MLELVSAKLSAQHMAGLDWFEENTGLEVPWPSPIGALFLANKAKGIHKPAGFEYALSVRQSLNGPYEDHVQWSADGRWELLYAQEGEDPDYYTNKALRQCSIDAVPVGVLIQVKEKPNPRYKVLGLGQITEDKGGIFTIRQFGSGPKQSTAAIDVVLPNSAFDPADIRDARLRTMRAIASRRGQPKFRRELLAAYGGKCAITGCNVADVLEAAHIIPYLGPQTNDVRNGLLLRADLHTLFDLGLIAINPEGYAIVISESLKGTGYEHHDGCQFRLPHDPRLWPDSEALRSRYTQRT